MKWCNSVLGEGAISILLTIALEFAIVPILSRTIRCELSFDAHQIQAAPPLVGIVVYYGTEKDNVLSERQKVDLKANYGRQSFCLPRDLRQLRLDLMYKNCDLSGFVIPHANLKVEKLPIDAGFELQDFGCIDRKIFSKFLAEDSLNSQLIKPSLRVNTLIGLFFVLYPISLILLRCARRYRPKLLAFFFLVLSIIPLVKLDGRDVSLGEKRVLSKYPPLREFSVGEISSFCQKFEAAFNDRFCGRDIFCSLRDGLRLCFDRADTTICSWGKGKWLFLKETLPLNRPHVSERKERIRDYLVGWNEYAKAHNKKFLLFIAPDKCRVYDEFLTGYSDEYLRSIETNETDEVVAYLRNTTDVCVVYPREELRRAKATSANYLYYVQDTHWNLEGAFEGGLKPIDAALARSVDYGKIVKDWVIMPFDGRGDMCDLFSDFPERLVSHEEIKSPTLLGNVRKDVIESDMIGHDFVFETISDVGKDTVFCMRDSFTSALSEFLSRDFQKCRYVWRYNVQPSDYPFIEKADVIILELVERYLRVLGDEKFRM